MITCTLIDFFSPFDKGIYIGLTISLFPFFGLFNGLVAARLYAFFNGTRWFALGTGVCVTLPLLIGGPLILLDVIEVFETNVYKVIPGYEAMTMFLFWVLVHNPASILGTAMGFYLTKYKLPTKPNRMPRDPPKSS